MSLGQAGNNRGPNTSNGGEYQPPDDPSTEELRECCEQLQRILRAREEMLSIISHDLRSPASAIKLSIELVRRSITDPSKELPPDQIERAIRKATSNVDRMMRMMDDLLAMSRAETDTFEIEWEDVDLRDVVEEVVANYQRALESCGSSLTIEGPQVLIGHWDWMRIQQIVANLVSNAIKYGQGNPITVSLDTQGDEAILKVSDQGRGIEPQQQSQIFDRYMRIDHQDHEEMDDSYGLGLWIVARIVEALGGQIMVDSEAGQGTTFTVRLPLDRNFTAHQ